MIDGAMRYILFPRQKDVAFATPFAPYHADEASTLFSAFFPAPPIRCFISVRISKALPCLWPHPKGNEVTPNIPNRGLLL
jgi:hypothetical protein